MRSAVFHGKENVRIEDVPEPGNASGKILVQVEWCGLCGTDLHLYQLGTLRSIGIDLHCADIDIPAHQAQKYSET